MIVVDASVALQWVAPEPGGQNEAESVLSAGQLCAPDLLLVEVANALRKKIASEQVTREQALRGLRAIGETLELRPVTPTLTQAALELALEMGHPVYDCLYLAFADELDGQVATRDAELVRRAARIGLEHRIAALPLSEAK